MTPEQACQELQAALRLRAPERRWFVRLDPNDPSDEQVVVSCMPRTSVVHKTRDTRVTLQDLATQPRDYLLDDILRRLPPAADGA